MAISTLEGICVADEVPRSEGLKLNDLGAEDVILRELFGDELHGLD